MKAPKFSYTRANSVDQVLTLLSEHGEDARILAGGQSLMPTLNMRLSQPEILIDINRLDALKGISVKDGVVRIGALARHVEVAESDIIAEHLPLIAEAMPTWPMSPYVIAAPSAAASRWPIRRRKCRPAPWR